MIKTIKNVVLGIMAAVLLFGTAFAGQMQNRTTNMSNQTITQIASTNPQFSTFVKALRAAGLTRTLNGSTNYTVFAPTNRAFRRLGRARLHQLMEPRNRAELKKILSYHVVRGDLPTAKVVHYSRLRTMEGQNIRVSSRRRGRVVLNNRARLTRKNIQASNGVIHVINRVLMPPKVSG